MSLPKGLLHAAAAVALVAATVIVVRASDRAPAPQQTKSVSGDSDQRGTMSGYTRGNMRSVYVYRGIPGGASVTFEITADSEIDATSVYVSNAGGVPPDSGFLNVYIMSEDGYTFFNCYQLTRMTNSHTFDPPLKLREGDKVIADFSSPSTSASTAVEVGLHGYVPGTGPSRHEGFAVR